ncbi:hypothetical protein [Lacinutrix chionoecetis]
MQTVHNLLNNNSFSQEDFNFTSVLVNNNWVLVNDIKERKTIYHFHEDNVLSIKKNDTISKAKWHYVNPNYIRITGENDINVIKINFRDQDILTLDIDRKSNELAVFINESKSEIPLNTYDAITQYLHNKYINKAKNIIHNHKYYYIEKSVEYGPFTAKELMDKAKKDIISQYCFIRETNDDNYSKRLRIVDLIKAI